MGERGCWSHLPSPAPWARLSASCWITRTRAQELREAGQRRVSERYGHASMVHQTLAVYADVLGRPVATAGRGAGRCARARPADRDDIDQILDLLTEYELPRAYFEPLYLDDPTYRPKQSWVVEQNDQLLAHLRVFDRTLLIQGVATGVAGIGNVITARASRGKGYAGRLLTTLLEVLPSQGYVYSLLGTAVPGLYARYGWVPVEQHVVRATLAEVPTWRGRLAPFQPDDLAEVMRLYATSNARRTGPTVRSADYWRGQLAWLRQDRDDFLVARTLDGELAGYVRCHARLGELTEILELGLTADDIRLGRHLLGQLGRRAEPLLEAHLPPSLVGIFHPEERVLLLEHGLMARVLQVESLVRTFRPVCEQRLRASGLGGAHLRLRLSAGDLDLHLGDSTPLVVSLHEAQLTHLLFHGRDASILPPVPERDEDVLLALFPAQDFVMWPADNF